MHCKKLEMWVPLFPCRAYLLRLHWEVSVDTRSGLFYQQNDDFVVILESASACFSHQQIWNLLLFSHINDTSLTTVGAPSPDKCVHFYSCFSQTGIPSVRFADWWNPWPWFAQISTYQYSKSFKYSQRLKYRFFWLDKWLNDLHNKAVDSGIDRLASHFSTSCGSTCLAP